MTEFATPEVLNDNTPEAVRNFRSMRREAIEGLQNKGYGRAITRTVKEKTGTAVLGAQPEPTYRDVLTGYMLPEPGGLSTLVFIGVDDNDKGMIYRREVKIPPEADDQREEIEAAYRTEYGPNARPVHYGPDDRGDLATVQDVINILGKETTYISVTHRSDRPEDRPVLSKSIHDITEHLLAKNEEAAAANMGLQAEFIEQVLPLVRSNDQSGITEQANSTTQTP